MFIDRARVSVKAGNGGNGCTSLYTDKYTRRGIPDGGNGGKGGDIIAKADKGLQTLYDFQFRRHFKAKSGTHGSSKNQRGKNGEDLVIRVPCGTIIRDADRGFLIKDLTAIDQEIVVAKGGRGGLGNQRKKPATQGELGDERIIQFELKLIADVGIIGYPNAGKSTLISKISNARPKIASYPFTTKSPVLGLVNLGQDRTFVVADIPGLIEGASDGKGLGHEFLRHIERTRLLVHMVDMAGVDNRRPYDDYLSVNKELELYSKELSKKPQIICANKMDLPNAAENIKIFKKHSKDVLELSALTGHGVKELLRKIWDELSKIKEEK